MLNQPKIPHRSVVSVLRSYGLKTAEATFLPSGDTNSAVYCVDAGGIRYFLKLRCGDFDEIAATVPAYLHSQGIIRLMAPIPATTGQPWIHAHGFDWMLYPFFEGTTGFERPLSQANWIALGETMRPVHATILPPDIARRVPRVSYSSQYRDVVRALDKGVADPRSFGDPVAAQVAEFWTKNRGDIRTVVERAGQLAEKMGGRAGALVLCHSDLHAGNVLIGADDALTVVDWDNPVFAPKERDLMFIGGGIGGAWNDLRGSGWFFHRVRFRRNRSDRDRFLSLRADRGRYRGVWPKDIRGAPRAAEGLSGRASTRRTKTGTGPAVRTDSFVERRGFEPAVCFQL